MNIPRSVFNEIVRATRERLSFTTISEMTQRKIAYDRTMSKYSRKFCDEMNLLIALTCEGRKFHATDAQIEAAYCAFGLEIEEGK